jgi:hypothetical protein
MSGNSERVKTDGTYCTRCHSSNCYIFEREFEAEARWITEKFICLDCGKTFTQHRKNPDISATVYHQDTGMTWYTYDDLDTTAIWGVAGNTTGDINTYYEEDDEDE